MNPRKKPGVVFWALWVLVIAIVGYPLSVGPVCWVSSRCANRRGPDGLYHVPFADKLYHPLTTIIARYDDGNGDSGLAQAFNRYSEVFAAETWNWRWFRVDLEWEWGGLR